jgi:hypothetical protein
VRSIIVIVGGVRSAARVTPVATSTAGSQPKERVESRRSCLYCNSVGGLHVVGRNGDREPVPTSSGGRRRTDMAPNHRVGIDDAGRYRHRHRGAEGLVEPALPVARIDYLSVLSVHYARRV